MAEITSVRGLVDVTILSDDLLNTGSGLVRYHFSWSSDSWLDLCRLPLDFPDHVSLANHTQKLTFTFSSNCSLLFCQLMKNNKICRPEQTLIPSCPLYTDWMLMLMLKSMPFQHSWACSDMKTYTHIAFFGGGQKSLNFLAVTYIYILQQWKDQCQGLWNM